MIVAVSAIIVNTGGYLDKKVYLFYIEKGTQMWPRFLDKQNQAYTGIPYIQVIQIQPIIPHSLVDKNKTAKRCRV